ncbi:ATP-dependent sacrificial sulfur transferase LarE [Methanosarcina sp. KYL-1]|uniref:ATP-dependent sacrificial sulfur transferase LarE n=1 Tax=Methanosarcina sp. KYL-1 TaxID=2602068 RepID=UPI002101506F|nr:ATP-dependent sacrificial sulfur transferase LarE [Methanosarcina sp. KYL-1]MCQ1534696.1 ATP-dependent sacrificial sulfur transferase LarE [Methanosarcina sp. KYL-1]
MDIEKIRKIKEAIKAKESAIIAFSGGVDSTTLASLALEVLGDRALAITIDSPLFPGRQLETAAQTACEIGIQHKVIPFSQLSVPYFSANTINRCYFCKKALLETLIEFAEKTGYKVVMEGTNASEIKGENRPGYRAVLEAGEKVSSPFVEFDVTKEEIREIASSLSLSAARRPSAACLATRFPYGHPITTEELQKVEKAEEYLFSLGFTQFRVRVHAKLARIEVIPEEFEEALHRREKISKHLKALGFDYITLDLEGFRSGSMDEPYLKRVTGKEEKEKEEKEEKPERRN